MKKYIYVIYGLIPCLMPKIQKKYNKVEWYLVYRYNSENGRKNKLIHSKMDYV